MGTERPLRPVPRPPPGTGVVRRLLAALALAALAAETAYVIARIYQDPDHQEAE